MAKASIGLGKGFDALLPQNFDKAIISGAASGERVEQIEISKISPNSEQPRHHFDEAALEQLASSIKQFGVLQPIIVTGKADSYELIAGERRWRASKIAGLNKVPAIVRSSEQLERLEIALIENVQRVDLKPLEQAASIERLHQQFNMSYDKIADRLGKATSTVNNIVRLLQLPDEAIKALNDEQISEGHARQILALKDYPEQQQELLQLIIEHGWSVRQAERFVTALKKGPEKSDTEEVQQRMRSETEETRKLAQKINAPVSIRRTAKGGKLEVGFTSDEELERLLGIFLNET